MKQCTRCSEIKPDDQFGADKRLRTGLKSRCRACESEAQREYASKRPNVIKERNRAQYLANVEKRKGYQRALRAADPEAARARDRERRAENSEHHRAVRYARYWSDPERFRAEAKHHHLVRMGAVFEVVDRKSVWSRDDGVCHLCGMGADLMDWHLEHIVPLSVGGAHSYQNTAVSHPSCNTAKGNRYVPSTLGLLGAYVLRPAGCTAWKTA